MKTIRSVQKDQIEQQGQQFEWRFYLFMNPDITQNGIKTQQSAKQHWLHYGRSEGRISAHPDREIFDFEYYSSRYKIFENIRERGQRLSDSDSIRFILEHWYLHGKKEGRWCRMPPKADDIIQNSPDYKHMSDEYECVVQKRICRLVHVKETEDVNVERKNENDFEDDIVIRIITRTSRRPNSFSQCRLSVLRQILPSNTKCFHHIVYDDPRDIWYISGDHVTKVEKIHSNECPFPSNEYINIALQQSMFKSLGTVQWNLVLDDDDMFHSPFALYCISERLQNMQNDTSKLIVWQTLKNDSDIIPKDVQSLKKNLPSCSFLFHQNYAKKYKWEPRRKGDLQFAMRVIENDLKNVIWIPKTLTSLQKGPGWGECVDIDMYPLRRHSTSIVNAFLSKPKSKNIIGKTQYGSIVSFPGKTTNGTVIQWGQNFMANLYTPQDLSTIVTKDLLQMYFERTFVLSLARRNDKWMKTRQRAIKSGIFSMSRFFGIDGANDVECHRLWEQYNKIPRKAPCIPSKGSLAILLSMRSLIVENKSKKRKSFMILQDDVIFCHDFLEKCSLFLKCVVSQIPNWKLIYLGCTQHCWPKHKFTTPINSKTGFYFPQGTADGAFAVAINENIYDELLQEIGTTEVPFDTGPLRTIQRRYPKECVCAWPYLMIADVSDSDCRPRRDQEKMAQKVHWDLNDFDLSC